MLRHLEVLSTVILFLFSLHIWRYCSGLHSHSKAACRHDEHVFPYDLLISKSIRLYLTACICAAHSTDGTGNRRWSDKEGYFSKAALFSFIGCLSE